MSIINYTPSSFTPVPFRHLLSDFFDVNSNITHKFMPGVDTIEHENEFLVHVEVPGMKKEDFKITLDDNNLIISGERKCKWSEEKSTLKSVETLHGVFKRSFHFPEEAQLDKITAEYKDGILELVVPKMVKTKKQPKLITIK